MPQPPRSASGAERRGGTAPVAVPRVLRRLKLRHLFFLLFLCSGIVPLLISSYLLIGDNQEMLRTQEKVLLTNSAQIRAQRLSDDLARSKEQLRQIGRGIVSAPAQGEVAERLRQAWVQEILTEYLMEYPEILALRAVDRQGIGLRFGEDLAESVVERMNAAFEEAGRSEQPVYRFAVLDQRGAPGVALAVPVSAESAGALILEVLLRLPLDPSGGAEGGEEEELFLIDADGRLLWSGGSRPEVEVALTRSDLVRDFARVPLAMSREYEIELGGERIPTLARVVPVEETGWGVVAHKPTAVAFAAVEEMVYNTFYSSLLLVVVALVFAVVAARWLSQPIQRLADASHEIAAGNFDRRVGVEGLGLEIGDLARDFNRMSEYVQNYIEQLKRAAEANRELFISTIRAFAATIDAKDPYTRGHSERVAAYSRAIARYLGLPKHVQERVWVSAVLHDVGKIGVDDRVLKKGGVLTAEEFEEMKRHPVIGAEIVEPISALREMIPGIRWHHEAWNGSGYPDGLKGEQIPLIARVIAVADTFDAITTNRPYQAAYEPEYALSTLKKLTGTKFDAKIVTAFLLAWEAGRIRMDRSPEDAAAPTAGTAAAS